MVAALSEHGVITEIIGPHGGTLRGGDGGIKVDKALPTTASVFYDAVLVPGGDESVQTIAENPDARRFIEEAYQHGKPIGALDSAVELLGITDEDVAPDVEGSRVLSRQGLIAGEGNLSGFRDAFVEALAAHRFPNRGREGAEAV